MRLAVCLLTADREQYTRKTLATFKAVADMPDFIRLHADDGSDADTNFQLAADADFETVYATNARHGPLSACYALWSTAINEGATHILHLENDWEFVRGFPLRDDMECMRLYGATKARDGDRMETGPHRMGTKEPIIWSPTEGIWERGFAHWAGPPSITRADLLCKAVQNAETFKRLSLTLNGLDTLRPVENMVWHIGKERTPGARFNV